MKIKVVDELNPNYEFTKDDLNSIIEYWHYKNIEPTPEQALEIIDVYTYHEIKKWGITDTVVGDNLYNAVPEFILKEYRSPNYYKDGNRQALDKEVFYEAMQQGYKAYKENDPAFEFTEEEKTQYLADKEAYFQNKIKKEKEIQDYNLKNNNKGLRDKTVMDLYNTENLDPKEFEKIILGNNISLSDLEMDKFIQKFTKKK